MKQLNIVNLLRSMTLSTQSKCLNHILATTVLVVIIIIIHMQNQKPQKIFITQPMSNNTSFVTVSSKTFSFILQSEFDVVLNYYNDDVTRVAQFIKQLRNLSTLQKHKHRIILYNKNPNITITYLKQVLNVDIVEQLDNIGREGATYLYHIVENYDKLANHTFFCQASPHDIGDKLEDWFLDRLEKQFNSSVGYMPLVSKQGFITLDCGIETPQENIKRLPELWAMLEQTFCPPDKQFVALNGQFLVSAERIRNRPLRIYKYLYELMTANMSHWIHRDPRGPPLYSNLDNPAFGNTMEHAWTTLFGCTNIGIIKRCDRGECACYD